jgi:DNA primase
MGRISGIAAKKREVAVTLDVVADCAKVLKNNRPAADGELSNDELLELFRSKNK